MVSIVAKPGGRFGPVASTVLTFINRPAYGSVNEFFVRAASFVASGGTRRPLHMRSSARFLRGNVPSELLKSQTP